MLTTCWLCVPLIRSNQHHCWRGKDDESTPDQIKGGICKDNERTELAISKTDRWETCQCRIKLQSALDRKDTSHYYRQLLWHHYNNHHSLYMYRIYNLLLVPLCLLQTNRWKYLLFYLSKLYCDIHVFSVVSPHSIFLPFHLKLFLVSTRLWH